MTQTECCYRRKLLARIAELEALLAEASGSIVIGDPVDNISIGDPVDNIVVGNPG